MGYAIEGKNFRSLFCPVVEGGKATLRFSRALSYSEQDWATANLPTPAGPLLQYMGGGGFVSESGNNPIDDILNIVGGHERAEESCAASGHATPRVEYQYLRCHDLVQLGGFLNSTHPLGQ